jgi:Ala-tRNA(Pro) deacylase
MRRDRLDRGGDLTVADDTDTYARLIGLLDQRGARYRLLDHAPEGRTELVSAMRGHEVRCAAKCLVILTKLGKKSTKFVLAVVPGNRRVDLNAIKTLLAATYVSFAAADVAERLAGSVAGTILPFAFSPDLEVVADPSLREAEELFFNAARLDRSIALRTDDYFAIAQPRVASIAERYQIEL